MVPNPTTFTYRPTGSRRRCVTITIVQDGILENIEFFMASVSSSDNSVVLPTAVLAIIQDSDSKLKRMEWSEA